MASSMERPDTEGPSDSGSLDNAAPTVILHILSPSLQAPNRITLSHLPLTTKIGELKGHIYRSVASRPRPETQRLIYRGKPLLNDEDTLKNIVDPADGSSHSMHLVLPPSEILSARADAPSSHITQPPIGQVDTPHPPSGYPQQPQGLRYRGAPLNSIRPPPTLPTLPVNRAAVPFGGQPNAARQHAAAEGPDVAVSETEDAQQTQTPTPLVTESVDIGGMRVPTGNTQSTPEPVGSNRRARETNPLRRGRETSERIERRTRRQVAGSTGLPLLSSVGHNSAWSQNNLPIPIGEPTQTNALGSNLIYMQHLITSLESQLNWGVVPPVEQISQIRTSLYQILDAQCQNPLAPRDGFAEGLLSRLSNLYIRADQLRIYRARFPNSTGSNNVQGNFATPYSQQTNVYLLSSPSGYQGLLIPPGNTAAVTTQAQATTIPPTATAGLTGDAARAAQPQAPRAAAMNAIQQALVQRRVEAGIRATFFARNARRIWLFVRLFFFCYLFSDPGTWSRMIMVCLAVLVSFLSETSAPQQIQRVVFDPIRRHLEGLVHIGGDIGINRPAPQPADPQTGQPQNRAGGTVGGDAAAPGIQQQLRRVERSVALFLASLVPGIGERHIEVRNAAEAALLNQERERAQEEERRAQAQEGGEQQADAPAAPEAQPLPAEQENAA